MTTDPEEGRRQVEQATQPQEFKVGDRVRLKAGGPEMRVVEVGDYGNQITCERTVREIHSRASLVYLLS